MSLIKKLFNNNERRSLIFTNEELIAARVCPNCWGMYEYEGKYKEFVEDQTKSNINKDHEHKKAFIAQFVETNVTGIRLKVEGDMQVCPRCHTGYKFVPLKAN